MRLDENYTLEATEQQWVLKYHSVKFDEVKNKNITTQREYYFNRLNEALRSYIDKKLKECESVGEAIITLHKELEELKTIKF